MKRDAATDYFSIKDISINFGGIRALDKINCDVTKGEIFGIVGPNGSGKTTTFNCINRIYNIDEGEILFKGNKLHKMKSFNICNLGIARTFQNIELFSNMTCLENILVGCHQKMSAGLVQRVLFLPSAKEEELKARARAEWLVDFLELQPAREQVVSKFPVGVQKLVELGRALATEPEILLLDEPASGMNVEEREELALRIIELRKHFGLTIILIDHDLRLVMDICDRVMVLNFGAKIAEGKPQDIQKDPKVQKAYVGEDKDIG